MKKFQALLVLVSLVFITFVGNAFGAEGESQPQTTGWFRVDSDALGLQVWAGGTHKVGPLNLASLIYVNSAQRGEFDLGLSFTHKSLTIVPMNGFQFDWGERRLVSLIPETFIYVTPESIPLYFESWVQFFVNRPFTDLPNQFYTRDYLLMRVSKNLLFGPQAELLMNVTKDGLNKDSILSLPVGGHADILYGPSDTLGLFLGYETIHSARRFTVQEATNTKPAVVEDRGLVGRLTYIHTW